MGIPERRDIIVGQLERMMLAAPDVLSKVAGDQRPT
jgi:hypothetical protein